MVSYLVIHHQELQVEQGYLTAASMDPEHKLRRRVKLPTTTIIAPNSQSDHKEAFSTRIEQTHLHLLLPPGLQVAHSLIHTLKGI